MKFLYLFLVALLIPVNGLSNQNYYLTSDFIKYPAHLVSEDKTIDIKTKKVAEVVGEITGISSVQFRYQMIETAQEPGDRIIKIDSPGGDVSAGQIMIDIMEKEKSMGVRQICIVTGTAYSMAFNLLTHCDVRLSTPKASFMFHSIAYTILDDHNEGRLTPKRLRHLAELLDHDEQYYRIANARALHISFKEYDIYCDGDAMWTPKKLLSLHYLDSIAEVD